jgi:hypothetical protein
VTAQGWTVTEAREQFEQAGLPVDGLARIIRALPGFQRIGETPAGEKGGRGHALYSIGELQRLHAALSPWLTAQEPAQRHRPEPGRESPAASSPAPQRA